MFPTKKPGMPAKGMMDNPADDIGQPAHNEPDLDESAIDGIMSGTDNEGAEGLFQDNPLESALTAAGFKPTPEQITQIESILKPVLPGKPAAKPGLPGAKPPAGGAVPSNMGSGDLPTL